MEQIVLYLAILAALSGFGMGLINLAGPILKRRNVKLPSFSLPDITSFLRRVAEGDQDEFDPDDLDDLSEARDFASVGSAHEEKSLLTRRRKTNLADEEELDEGLASVLDQVAAEVLETSEDGVEESEDDTYFHSVVAGASNETEDEDAEDELSDEDEDAEDELSDEDEDAEDELSDEDEDAEDELSEDEDAEDELSDEEDEEDEDSEEAESTPVEVHLVAAGGDKGDDILSFFGEAADAGVGEVAAWREDLPEVSIQELLAEARAVNQQFHGKKSTAE